MMFEYNESAVVQAQEDWYNGIRFRSKLESKTAQALDNIGIPYEYESVDGYKLSNGMWYKPDFWLNTAKMFIECKGVMKDIDCAKIIGLVEDYNKPVLAISYTSSMLFTKFFNEPSESTMTYTGKDVVLAQCSRCGGKWFYAVPDSFECRCCGTHDGDHHLIDLAVIDSGQRLFEYGQKIAADKPIYRELSEKFNN